MNKKEFDMSQLVSGLTGEEEMESATERKVQSAAKRKKPMEHVCTLIATEQMAKVRTIAEREGLAIKDIIAVGLRMAIGNYEAKNGEIKVKKAKRGNASDVFGMEDEA
jgi:phosphopantetheine adenylyltransferase